MANQHKYETLIEELREMSEHPKQTTQDIIDQWHPVGIEDSGHYDDECLCTTKIRYLCTIQNIHNGNEATVGRVCYTHFSGDPIFENISRLLAYRAKAEQVEPDAKRCTICFHRRCICRKLENTICQVCNEILPIAEARRHYKQQHDDVYCWFCNKLLQDESSLMRHVRIVHRDQLRICGQCNEIVETSKIGHHFRLFHSAIYCETCNELFPGSGRLEAHIRLRHLHLICDCGLAFSRMRELNYHKGNCLRCLKQQKLGFGKYRNKSFGEVFSSDPSYIRWIQREFQPDDARLGIVDRIVHLMEMAKRTSNKHQTARRSTGVSHERGLGA